LGILHESGFGVKQIHRIGLPNLGARRSMLEAIVSIYDDFLRKNVADTRSRFGFRGTLFRFAHFFVRIARSSARREDF
jgi:hypothetical protein